jgi:hypothetical protein
MKILVRGCPAGAMGQMPLMYASPRLISREIEGGGSGVEPGVVLGLDTPSVQ